MKKQLIWVFEWRKFVHYWWSYISFSPECKELPSMLDPLLYRWGVPPVVIRCVHWTMQMWVLQTWIKAQGIAIVMEYNQIGGLWQILLKYPGINMQTLVCLWRHVTTFTIRCIIDIEGDKAVRNCTRLCAGTPTQNGWKKKQKSYSLINNFSITRESRYGNWSAMTWWRHQMETFSA